MTVSVPEYFLTSYDAYNTGVYILEEGAHYLTIADDAHAAANNILTVKGKTTADGMTADGDASMVYTATYSFDATTYAKAYGTGNDVTSLFAAADVNRYEGSGDQHGNVLLPQQLGRHGDARRGEAGDDPAALRRHGADRQRPSLR